MSWTHTRSEIAVALKADPTADVTELRRRLKEERLEEHIKSIVDSAPPLTDTQRKRLAHILAGRPLDSCTILTQAQQAQLKKRS